MDYRSHDKGIPIDLQVVLAPRCNKFYVANPNDKKALAHEIVRHLQAISPLRPARNPATIIDWFRGHCSDFSSQYFFDRLNSLAAELQFVS
jgi:hypothetical protein